MGGEHEHLVPNIPRGFGQAPHVGASGVAGEPRVVVGDDEQPHQRRMSTHPASLATTAVVPDRSKAMRRGLPPV